MLPAEVVVIVDLEEDDSGVSCVCSPRPRKNFRCLPPVWKMERQT